MRYGTCLTCGGWAYVEEEPAPESGCDDLTFAEHEQGAAESIEQGNQCALLYFIDFCFQQRRAVPSWAQAMFQSAVAKARGFEVWDEAFGPTIYDRLLEMRLSPAFERVDAQRF